MLKLTDLEFSETLELDKTIHLKGGYPSNTYNSEVDVSSNEISIDIDTIDVSMDLDPDLYFSNDLPFSLYPGPSYPIFINHVCCVGEADIAVVPNS